jgi:hypothetical protein
MRLVIPPVSCQGAAWISPPLGDQGRSMLAWNQFPLPHSGSPTLQALCYRKPSISMISALPGSVCVRMTWRPSGEAPIA